MKHHDSMAIIRRELEDVASRDAATRRSSIATIAQEVHTMERAEGGEQAVPKLTYSNGELLPRYRDTIVDPGRAPLGRELRFVGVCFLEPPMTGKEQYRAEAWRLSDGQLVVIVSDNGGMSLANASSFIAQAVDEMWPGDRGQAIIIEDWSEAAPFGESERFLESSRDGGHYQVDLKEWAAKGLWLPPLPGQK